MIHVRILCFPALAAVLLGACATNDNPNQFGPDAGPDSPFVGNEGGGGDSGPCGQTQYQATQAPTALLVLLQRSGSMSQNNKWAFAAQALVQALDQPAFDDVAIGLMAAPNATVTGPACVFNLPVACSVPAFPQVDFAIPGQKHSSDPTGVRHGIKNWLTMNAPDQSAGEGNPLYSAVQIGIGALQGWSAPPGAKRILFVVTDGAISCTSLSNRQGYTDGNGCTDWENPNNIMTLVSTANKDATSPVDTFIVGVPGSDSYDASGVNFPPYHMRAALSDIAKAGSPGNVPVGCTATNPFQQTDPDPSVSCHFDMTQNYSAQAVATAIQQVRGKVLGCIFDLPKPDGGIVDPGQVNVDYTVGGGNDNSLYRRKDSSNDCANDGCWDYTSDGKVELIGKACDDVKNAPDAKVNIQVGCATVVK